MGLALLSIVPVTQRDVEVAWATYRTLILAEADDPSLQEDLTHQEAIRGAQERFARLYDEWSRQ
jgi:hypothetical protein